MFHVKNVTVNLQATSVPRIVTCSLRICVHAASLPTSAMTGNLKRVKVSNSATEYPHEPSPHTIQTLTKDEMWSNLVIQEVFPLNKGCLPHCPDGRVWHQEQIHRQLQVFQMLQGPASSMDGVVSRCKLPIQRNLLRRPQEWRFQVKFFPMSVVLPRDSNVFPFLRSPSALHKNHQMFGMEKKYFENYLFGSNFFLLVPLLERSCPVGIPFHAVGCFREFDKKCTHVCLYCNGWFPEHVRVLKKKKKHIIINSNIR